jgi:hypothetical protein
MTAPTKEKEPAAVETKAEEKAEVLPVVLSVEDGESTCCRRAWYS